jgi:WS/DGAT/MGAT family acyltransferase
MDELVNAWVADRFTPFQIALLGVFDAGPFLLSDGALDVLRIRRELVARACRVDAFRRRVVWTRFGEGMPVWAPDPSFDPNRHVEGATLPAGADLATWAADRVVRPLPLDRPLWRAEIVNGLPGERFALIVVVHHVAADGRTGVGLAGSLFDATPDAAPPDTPVPAAPPIPSHAELIRDRLHGLAAALRRARPPSGAGFRRLRTLVRQFRDASADLRTRTSETSLPRQVGPTRRLVVVREPLDELRRAGHALGATVNDLLLASVSGGLRALLSARGDDVAALTLRTSVPAATGAGHQASGIMLVDLPVGEPDPLRRLAAIHATTARAKGGSTPERGAYPRSPTCPSRWRASECGGCAASAAPGPLVPHVGLGVAALSYAGELAVSVHADGSVADLELLADGMAADFAAFRAAAATAVPAKGRAS